MAGAHARRGAFDLNHGLGEPGAATARLEYAERAFTDHRTFEVLALERFGEHPDQSPAGKVDPFHLAAVVDLGLPDASGADLVSELRAYGRDIPVVVVSGYGSERLNTLPDDRERITLLEKPFDGPVLKQALDMLGVPVI